MKQWTNWIDESLSYLFRNVDVDDHLQLWFEELDKILVKGRGPEIISIPASVRREFACLGEPMDDPDHLLGWDLSWGQVLLLERRESGQVFPSVDIRFGSLHQFLFERGLGTKETRHLMNRMVTDLSEGFRDVFDTGSGFHDWDSSCLMRRAELHGGILPTSHCGITYRGKHTKQFLEWVIRHFVRFYVVEHLAFRTTWVGSRDCVCCPGREVVDAAQYLAYDYGLAHRLKEIRSVPSEISSRIQ